MSSKKNEHKKKQEEDEVEKLLRATEDDILLKLSVDSHMSRGSSSRIIHPDLDRRFQALRSSSKSKPTVDKSDAELNKATVSVGDEDDLFARFAALKSTLPSYSKSSENVGNDGEDDGDEVDEVIRWAIDAAALDPSPPSGDDVTDDSSDDQTDEDDDIKKKDHDKNNNKKKKGGRK